VGQARPVRAWGLGLGSKKKPGLARLGQAEQPVAKVVALVVVLKICYDDLAVPNT
jgi:hypothetical protein